MPLGRRRRQGQVPDSTTAVGSESGPVQAACCLKVKFNLKWKASSSQSGSQQAAAGLSLLLGLHWLNFGFHLEQLELDNLTTRIPNATSACHDRAVHCCRCKSRNGQPSDSDARAIYCFQCLTIQTVQYVHLYFGHKCTYCTVSLYNMFLWYIITNMRYII